jgi:hypothetical protein
VRKKGLIFLIFFFSALVNKAEKVLPDSTVPIVSEWISAIKDSSYIYNLTIRGGKATYESGLKLITQSLHNYQIGEYVYAFEDAEDIKKVEGLPEINRIKLFLMTMSKIKSENHFKAKKWYFISRQDMSSSSFARLERNVRNSNLGYNIDNYTKVKSARITALLIIGFISLIPTLIQY